MVCDALPTKADSRKSGAEVADAGIPGSSIVADEMPEARQEPLLEKIAEPAEQRLEIDAPTAPASVASAAVEEAGSEEIKRVGPLEISHGLYSIFLTEADECIRVLANDIAEWRYEPARAVTPNLIGARTHYQDSNDADLLLCRCKPLADFYAHADDDRTAAPSGLNQRS